MKCNDCDTAVANHKWAVIKAHAAGWFFGRDGSAYCPEHLPTWVAQWRKKRS